MAKLISFIFFIICASGAFAQNFTVEGMKYQPDNVMAQANPVKDENGVNCAMIILSLPLEGVTVSGNILKEPVYNGGKYYVYVSAGTKKIRIMHSKCITEEIVFEKYGYKSVESEKVYTITVKAPELTRYESQRVTFKANTSNVKLKATNEENGNQVTLKTDDGSLSHNFVNGKFRYVAKSKGYEDYHGEFINDGYSAEQTIEMNMIDKDKYHSGGVYFDTPKMFDYSSLPKSESMLGVDFGFISSGSIDLWGGYDYRKFNIEAFLGLGYQNMFEEEGNELDYGLRIGFVVPIIGVIKMTPQVGVRLLTIQDDGTYAAMSCGIKIDYALAKKFKIAVTPAYYFDMSDIEEYLNRRVNSGFSIKVGLYYALGKDD